MAVWLCIPSARVDGGTIQQWRAKGYRAAIWRDPGAPSIDAEILVEKSYPGYGAACNDLARMAFAADPDCLFIVCAGDDTEPAVSHPDLIAFECGRHFGKQQERYRVELTMHSSSTHNPSTGFIEHTPTQVIEGRFPWSTFGVMQPTGDRFAGGSIDRIAGSPWIGKEFCLRTYNGSGPYNSAYRHMFVDEELFNVAHKLKCYWPRPELIHLHHHFMRESPALESNAVRKPVPKHLFEANSQRHWDVAKGIFLEQKAKGFTLGCTLAEGER